MIRFDYHFRVRYKDIDRMGIMYYSRYFEYFEEARTEMMRALGLDYNKLEENGVLLPVIKAKASYIAGAKYDQKLILRTEIRDIHHNRIEFFYSVRMGEREEDELVTGKTVHAFVTPGGRTIRLPKEVEEILRKHWGETFSDE